MHSESRKEQQARLECCCRASLWGSKRCYRFSSVSSGVGMARPTRCAPLGNRFAFGQSWQDTVAVSCLQCILLEITNTLRRFQQLSALELQPKCSSNDSDSNTSFFDTRFVIAYLVCCTAALSSILLLRAKASFVYICVIGAT